MKNILKFLSGLMLGYSLAIGFCYVADYCMKG